MYDPAAVALRLIKQRYALLRNRRPNHCIPGLNEVLLDPPIPDVRPLQQHDVEYGVGELRVVVAILDAFESTFRGRHLDCARLTAPRVRNLETARQQCSL